MATSQSIPFPSNFTADSDESAKMIVRFRNWLFARKGLARSTVALYGGMIRNVLRELGTFPTVDQLDEYVGRVRTTRSFSHVINMLIVIERYQEFRGEPVKYDRPRKPCTLPPPTLTEAEIAVMLSQQNPRNRVLLGLLAYSGIRNNEICNLLVEDLDVSEGIVRVRQGKGQHGYSASIPGPCIELMTAYLKTREAKPTDWLFVTKRHGYQLEQQDLRKIVRVAARGAGLDAKIHPHSFRHSLAMNLLNRGAHPMTIQKQLGHRHLSTTMYYLRGDYTRARAEYLLCAPSYV